MSGQQKFYITTAISYPNGPPHIGHAYEAIATDAIARFERLDGKDVFFLTGTDEHGLKMKQTAVAEGLSPQALADRNSQRFRDMMVVLNVSQISADDARKIQICNRAEWFSLDIARD